LNTLHLVVAAAVRVVAVVSSLQEFFGATLQPLLAGVESLLDARRKWGGPRLETLDEIWAGDLLNRREDAQLLINFLTRRHAERVEAGIGGAYVVNLNASWGHGKTYFLERLKRQMEVAGHLTAFVNAWRDDSSRDPVVAVMAAVEASLKPHFAKENAAFKAWTAAKANSATILASLGKGALRQLIKKGVGEGLEEIENLLTQEELVSKDVEKALTDNSEKVGDAVVTEVTTLLTKYVDQKITDYQARITSAAQFQVRMRQVLADLGIKKSIKLPFFVLIDELDRCRPTYAIEMLEQVKHLFDIDNTIFIIATDGDQLSHSIKAVYGEGFDGKRYLLRFFNRHYKFEERDLVPFTRYLFESNNIDMTKIGTPLGSDPFSIFVGAMHTYSVTLRDAEQCFDLLRSVVTTWEYNVPIELSLILPLIIFYHRHDTKVMEEYMRNNGGELPSNSKWTFEFDQRDDFGRAVSRSQVSVESLNKELLVRAKEGLRNIFDYTGTSAASRYTADVLQREFQMVHQNRIAGTGPLSIINEYPAIVRRLGRLSAAQ
jgi:hypothetical protein